MWISPEGHAIVGGILERFRREAGITQQQLAARLNKPQSFVSSYEAGQRRIDILELILITGQIGVDPMLVFHEVISEFKST